MKNARIEELRKGPSSELWEEKRLGYDRILNILSTAGFKGYLSLAYEGRSACIHYYAVYIAGKLLTVTISLLRSTSFRLYTCKPQKMVSTG